MVLFGEVHVVLIRTALVHIIEVVRTVFGSYVKGFCAVCAVCIRLEICAPGLVSEL